MLSFVVVLSYVAKLVWFKVGMVQGHRLCNVYGCAARWLIMMHKTHICANQLACVHYV